MKNFFLAFTLLCLASNDIHSTSIFPLANPKLPVGISHTQTSKSLIQKIAQVIRTTANTIKQIHWTKTNIAKAGLYTLISAGAVWCITKAAKWLLYTPHAKMIQQAEQSLTKVNTYQIFINILTHHYGEDFNNPDIASFINENILTELATAIEMHNTANINKFIAEMKKSIDDLTYHASRLKKRIQEIKKTIKDNQKNLEAYTRMRKVRSQITQSITQLTIAHNYIAHHKNFFELHIRSLHIAATHGNGQDGLQIQANQVNPRVSFYPRIEYITRLNQDLGILNQTLQQPSINVYPLLSLSAFEVFRRLSAARDQFILTPEYTQELRAQQEAIRQQAILAEQRRQTNIQQQRLREEQKANALASLNQRRKQEHMTEQQYHNELQRIDSSHFWLGIIDTLSH